MVRFYEWIPGMILERKQGGASGFIFFQQLERIVNFIRIKQNSIEGIPQGSRDRGFKLGRYVQRGT